jgi:hypothetical protein
MTKVRFFQLTTICFTIFFSRQVEAFDQQTFFNFSTVGFESGSVSWRNGRWQTENLNFSFDNFDNGVTVMNTKQSLSTLIVGHILK